MSIKTFLKEVARHDEFKNLEISAPEGNLLSYTGHIIGLEAKERFQEHARKHGFLALADDLHTWTSEEDYVKYKDVPVRTMKSRK